MRRLIVLSPLFLSQVLSAQADSAAADAPDSHFAQVPGMSVVGSGVANTDPAATFSSPVTLLRFQPFVDVQSRGLAETQADVVVRGGTFENTGFKLGAVNLFDPQTGHYFSEIPVDTLMLGQVQVLTGAANALEGFNSSVGTLAYDWMPITCGGIVEGGVGTDGLYFGRVAAGNAFEGTSFLGRTLAVQASAAYSEGDGTIEFGDHRFRRFGARLQLVGQGGQSDVYAGWQSKFYGWPGMYTGNPGLQETEDYDVLLLVANHTQNYGDGSHWAAGTYYRGFDDDYELDRDRPGYYRPYQHQTRVVSAAAEGRHLFGNSMHLDWRAEALGDEIESTELTYAGFMSRSYWKATLLPGMTLKNGSDSIDLSAGASWDDSNRDSDSLSPILLASYRHNTTSGYWQLYSHYTRTTQVPGYTALGSNPSPGAFSGSAGLPREAANNYEVGVVGGIGQFQAGASVFYRQHHNLADWTYDIDAPGTYRKATPVDLDVQGAEVYAGYTNKPFSLTVSYAWLNIDPEYNDARVDASFYALNYPVHRATLAAAWRLVDSLELRVEAEARQQENNIRRSSDTEALLANASITWDTPFDGFSVALIADNIGDSDYQEFPGVPAEGRQLGLRTSYAW